MTIEYTVLVVEDEKILREGCARLLNREGFRVLRAASGQEAVQILATEPVDVIICDLKMPVMDGLGLLEETKAKYPSIPVIMITGHGTVESVVECMKKGAHDLLTKPFRADHLLKATRNALESCLSKKQ